MKWFYVIILLIFVSSASVIQAQFLDDTPDRPEEMAPAPLGWSRSSPWTKRIPPTTCAETP